MDGTLDIQRISNPGSTDEDYQVRYEDLIGESFAGAMSKEELHLLLYHKLALNLSDEDLDLAMERLNSDGRVIFPEITVKSNELAGAGLQYLEVEG